MLLLNTRAPNSSIPSQLLVKVAPNTVKCRTYKQSTLLDYQVGILDLAGNGLGSAGRLRSEKHGVVGPLSYIKICAALHNVRAYSYDSPNPVGLSMCACYLMLTRLLVHPTFVSLGWMDLGFEGSESLRGLLGCQRWI